mgnify:CR=1 FL=1
MAETCARCENRGYRIEQVPEDHALYGPRILMREVTCECIAGQRRIWGLPARFLAWDFDTYPGLSGGRETVRAWTSCYNPPWLLLSGSVGTGKTGLAVCAYKSARLLWREGAAFWTVAAMLEAVKATFGLDDRERSEHDIMRRLQERIRFLVLDDLGAERPTEWAQDALRQVLLARYDRMLPTVMTTNLSLSELETWLGRRVMDRMRNDALVVALRGESLRQAQGTTRREILCRAALAWAEEEEEEEDHRSR